MLVSSHLILGTLIPFLIFLLLVFGTAFFQLRSSLRKRASERKQQEFDAAHDEFRSHQIAQQSKGSTELEGSTRDVTLPIPIEEGGAGRRGSTTGGAPQEVRLADLRESRGAPPSNPLTALPEDETDELPNRANELRMQSASFTQDGSSSAGGAESTPRKSEPLSTSALPSPVVGSSSLLAHCSPSALASIGASPPRQNPGVTPPRAGQGRKFPSPLSLSNASPPPHSAPQAQPQAPTAPAETPRQLDMSLTLTNDRWMPHSGAGDAGGHPSPKFQGSPSNQARPSRRGTTPQWNSSPRQERWQEQWMGDSTSLSQSLNGSSARGHSARSFASPWAREAMAQLQQESILQEALKGAR